MQNIYRSAESVPAIPRLALKPAEMAKSLGVSEKFLFSLSAPRGTLPVVRIGSRVVYFLHQVQKWADEQLALQQAVQQPETTKGG